MTVFGIGTLELVLILLLLILIFGPDRISEMGRWLGQAYQKISGISAEVDEQVRHVRKAVNSTLDMPSLTGPATDVVREIDQFRKDISKAPSLTEPISQMTEAISRIKQETTGALRAANTGTSTETPKVTGPDPANTATLTEAPKVTSPEKKD